MVTTITCPLGHLPDIRRVSWMEANRVGSCKPRSHRGREGKHRSVPGMTHHYYLQSLKTPMEASSRQWLAVSSWNHAVTRARCWPLQLIGQMCQQRNPGGPGEMEPMQLAPCRVVLRLTLQALRVGLAEDRRQSRHPGRVLPPCCLSVSFMMRGAWWTKKQQTVGLHP